MLLLLRIKDVDTPIFSSSGWYATWEISKLVQLVEILGSLKQYFLIFCKMVIWIVIGVPEDGYILLQISDLIVQVDKFLSLLLEQ